MAIAVCYFHPRCRIVRLTSAFSGGTVRKTGLRGAAFVDVADLLCPSSRVLSDRFANKPLLWTRCRVRVVRHFVRPWFLMPEGLWYIRVNPRKETQALVCWNALLGGR